MSLSETQIQQFHEQGYLLVDNAVSTEQLSALQIQFQQWVEESCEHNQPYGETIDDRARFDLEPGHSADTPALRRVNSPVEGFECIEVFNHRKRRHGFLVNISTAEFEQEAAGLYETVH